MADNVLLGNVLAGLERLGYSKERATERVKIYNNATKGSTLYHRRKYNEDLELIITGSRREGLASFWVSDTDEMIVPAYVACCETGINPRGEHVTIDLDFEDAPSGYTFLKLANDGLTQRLPKMINWEIVQKGNTLYLKNTQEFRDETNKEDEESVTGHEDVADLDTGWMRHNITQSEITGPAFPFSIPMPMGNRFLNYDRVLALKCYCSGIHEWCDSKRKYDWPGLELIEKIKGLNAHVVPTGVKGSIHETLQWRICYTLAEIELVKSFNDTQIKVYAVLKMLAKGVLEPALKTRTSEKGDNVHVPGLTYIMKNIMFWISEDGPVEMFTKEQFFERLLETLVKLKKYLEEENLPNYMIPSRNLCMEKLTPEQRVILLSEIEDILKEGLEFLKRIPQLADEINNSNEEELNMKAMKRFTEEQFLLSTFTLPPEQLAEVILQFHDAHTREESGLIYVEKVLPYFRQNNTSGFFEQFSHMSDEEIFRKILMQFYGQLGL
ncbi:uncharacterized protein LOC123552232 [Mercenaria mercenaria]|uniref:uncharacterized protein LOC123552232 n=1 Tax=Mercenaria mercenaria TaxID=6596 RepID=UPI001E1DA02C|nr:uncharacterized protein LOC123552232 [Mercenaria mercenaria]